MLLGMVGLLRLMVGWVLPLLLLLLLLSVALGASSASSSTASTTSSLLCNRYICARCLGE